MSAHVFSDNIRNRIISKMSTILAASVENRARVRYSRMTTRVRSCKLDSRAVRAGTRLIRASTTTRACGRAGSRTVIYVPICAATRDMRDSRIPGRVQREENGKAGVCVRACARKSEWKRIRREKDT